MNLQAAKTNFEREVAAKEEAAEEARRNITKQLRELETQLEDERKARTLAQSSAKKIASDLAEIESLIESETKGKDDALRMYKKAQVSGCGQALCGCGQGLCGCGCADTIEGGPAWCP